MNAVRAGKDCDLAKQRVPSLDQSVAFGQKHLYAW